MLRVWNLGWLIGHFVGVCVSYMERKTNETVFIQPLWGFRHKLESNIKMDLWETVAYCWNTWYDTQVNHVRINIIMTILSASWLIPDKCNTRNWKSLPPWKYTAKLEIRRLSFFCEHNNTEDLYEKYIQKLFINSMLNNFF